MSTDIQNIQKRGGIVPEGVLTSPVPSSLRSSNNINMDTPPAPPRRSMYYDMSPQVPQRHKGSDSRRSSSRSRRSGSQRRSKSSSRRSAGTNNNTGVSSSSHHSTASTGSRRSRSSSSRRSSSRNRRSSSRSRRSSSRDTRRRRSSSNINRRSEGMRRSSSENKPGAYSYYDDINDYEQALKAKAGQRRFLRRSESSRRSPPSDSFSHQEEEDKIYDEAFGDCTPDISVINTPPSKTHKKSDQPVGDFFNDPISPTSIMTETSHQDQDDDSDSEIVLPGAYASNFDGEDLRLSRLSGRTKSRRAVNHMRVSMGGLDPLSLSNRDESVTSTERSFIEARKESRRSYMARAASEGNTRRSNSSSSRRLVRDASSASLSASFASSLAVAMEVPPAVSHTESEEDDLQEEIVHDEYDAVEYQSDHHPKHVLDSSESTAEDDDNSEDNVVSEIIAPKFRRSNKKRLSKKRKNQRHIRRHGQACVYYCFVAAFLLIFGGGALFLLLRPDRSPTQAPRPPNATTTINSTNTHLTETPSLSPTADRKNPQPTEPYVYAPPSLEDCTSIRKDGIVMGQSDMAFRSFNLHFDVTLDDQISIDVDSWLAELLRAIETVFVPTLAGCDEIHQDETRRRLALLRYVVANADIDGDPIVEGTCTTTSDKPCFRVVVNLKVYLKGNVRIAQLLNLIVGLIEVEGFKGVSLGSVRKLNAAPVLVDEWALSSVFKAVTLARIEASETPESSTPTNFPSLSPSTSAPSASPSAKPSAKPSHIDTSGLETGKSLSATPGSSQGPTVRASNPPSTVAPSMTPTLAPTSRPTAAPSRMPSFSPTSKPTLKPTPSPTRATREPTEAPSETPTFKPASASPPPVPTVSPTDKPSHVTSAAPSPSQTERPTLQGSVAPTSGITTVYFSDVLIDSGTMDQCQVDPVSITGTYKNLEWNNLGAVDTRCNGCSGQLCPIALTFVDASRRASIKRQSGTFDLVSMWINNPKPSPFTMRGLDETREAIHSESFADIGMGWQKVNLSAFKQIATLEIENSGGDPDFEIFFDAIQLRFK